MVKPVWLFVVTSLLATLHPGARGQSKQQSPALRINEEGYYETQGLNVMMFDDFYPEGHQGGVSVIQNGQRVATNGDLRLDPTPGQWQPTPAVLQHSAMISFRQPTIFCWSSRSPSLCVEA